MMTWQRSAPSSQTNPIHQHSTLQDVDSPSDPPCLREEEILEFQAEYPQEEVEEEEVEEEEVEEEEVEEEEVEEAEEEVSLLQYQHNKQLPMEETNLLATHHLYSQEIA